MKRILLASAVIGLLVSALAFSGAGKKTPATAELQIDIENRNPWTHLRLNDAAEKFHFIVVSDRTGGHRARIFSQAVEQINLLQPAFVVSVGDLIEGYSKDPAVLAAQWKEFQGYAHKLNMPFFYVPGNHDVSNPVQADLWKERFGKRYYHFLYKDVLFLAVNSDDPNETGKEGRISKEQVEYFEKVLKENSKVRWIFVCLHKPIWTQNNLDTNGWLDIEKALAGRKYTVFAGHIHHYQKFVRQGMNYYQLATTGGGSRLRGLAYGEFDHVAWVTMKPEGAPVIANLMLDGILPENLKKPITDEEGDIFLNRKPVHPVLGKVTFDGTPGAGAQIVYWLPDAKDKEGKKLLRVSDAFVEVNGAYAMSAYAAFDGLPEGDYKVTVTLRQPLFEPSGKPGANLLPARYESPLTSELTAAVKTGKNVIDFHLTK